MMNSSIPLDEGGEDDHPTSQARFREIGFPAVAAALYCAQLPPPADERGGKHPHEPLWADLWAEQPRFSMP